MSASGDGDAKQIIVEPFLDLSDESSSDEVELTGGTAISLKDPWTMRPMKNPLRNKICNHFYDSDTVNDLIKRKARVQCPVLGCVNKNFITRADLVEDRDAVQQVRQLSLSPNQKSVTCTIDLVDDSD
ncbi:E3 SUMO-protein ligase nse2-like [Drosophila obscura]|uniref:E3 SUMO-protein ligase nse2-like n=1 Tax=Drosophila obscura TaxID=7282 RepID=UPI001BB2A236|nr:E3 SUMO-protein ligase nse2-like [Drosophila obscura]